MAARVIRKALIAAGVVGVIAVVARQYPSLKREIKMWMM